MPTLLPESAPITHPAALSAAAVLSAQAPAAWPRVAAHLDALFYALDNGHSFIYLSAEEAENVQQAAPIVGAAGAFAPLILQGRRLFLGRLWQLEQDIAADFWRLANAPVAPVDSPAAAACLQAWFADKDSQGQQTAAALALLQPLMLINGGPGTGKTTTVANLLALLCQNSVAANQGLPRIGLAAPTGKAAAHMAQALQSALLRLERLPEATQTHLQALQGQTVHRLLGLYPPQLQSRFHARNPLPLDILVVDEASMLDLSLLKSLLHALRSGCRLILLGDENQLPAVGAGDVLAALAQPTRISSALAAQLAALLPQTHMDIDDAAPPLAANVATLTVSRRFDDKSGIGHLAKAVVAGQGEAALAAFTDFSPELQWMSPTQTPWPLLYQRQAAYWQAVAQQDATAAFAALKHIMVLAAWRQDAAAFNQGYRRYLAQQGHGSEGRWFAGQVLMVTQNDYGTALYNGDIGIVLPQGEGLAAYFSDGERCRHISLSRLPEHDTAFAITVHKSQGSEYDEVWLLPPSGSEDAAALFDRALLYTAITRARNHFVFWGEPAQLQAAIARNSPRRSGLRLALAHCAAQAPSL